MSSSSSQSRRPSSPPSRPPLEEHDAQEPIPYDLVKLYCQENRTLKSYSVPTEPACKGFLYCQVRKITGLRPFERVGFRFESQNSLRSASFTLMGDHTGNVRGLDKEFALAFHDFQGSCPVKVTLFAPATIMSDQKDLSEVSFRMRESSLVNHIMHQNGGEHRKLPEYLDEMMDDTEISPRRDYNIKKNGSVLPTVTFTFENAKVSMVCDVASVVDGDTRLLNGELLLKSAVREKRFILVSLLLKLGAGRDLSLWSKFDIFDVNTDVEIAELLVNQADFFPKHRHCRQAIMLGHAELLDFYLMSGGGFAILLPEKNTEDDNDNKTETLLTLACGLADVDCVQVILDYAREEKVVCDPFAPTQEPIHAHPLAAILNPQYIEQETYAQIWTEQFEFADSPVVAVVRGFPDGPPQLLSDVSFTPDRARLDAFGTADIPRGTIEARIAIIDLLAGIGFTMSQKSGLDALSPLIAAVELGSLPLVQKLLQHKCGVYPGGINGFTPLHQACKMAHWHLLPVLLQAVREQAAQPGPALGRGLVADHLSLNKVDSFGRTCLDIALANVIQESAAVDPTLIGAEVGDKKWLRNVRALLNAYYEHGMLELAKPLPFSKAGQCDNLTNCSFIEYCNLCSTSSVQSVTSIPRAFQNLAALDVFSHDQPPPLSTNNSGLMTSGPSSVHPSIQALSSFSNKKKSTDKYKTKNDGSASFSFEQLQEDFYLTPERETQYAQLAESLRALDLLVDAGAETKVYSMSLLVNDFADDFSRGSRVSIADSSGNVYGDNPESVSDYNYSDGEIDV